ncbi:hypothetical protein B0H21DRAFT_722324 [Amylocystis lapponica]|nr:hypothetical protein B0H21DRAFT_722324 [Amylocystis lapponica]
MERLCDEVIQLVLNEISNPTSFSLVSKRFYEFTQDPYVRASYFLARYGRIQALYWALGRGKLMNERVINVMLSSGAHLSRYLAQSAIHHYFRTQVPFIKTPWVRTIPLPVFTHFMTVAARMYGDIPVGKGDDDGSLFAALLKQSRFPTESRSGKWEALKEVLEKYKFIPFCHKDPMMAQFPLVLAIEPRLLPYARANGFTMDRKYRNFVFRKMFEKSAVASEGRVEDIVRNVRELSRLDPDMFLSRTVAAEICMEAKTNEPAYMALKRLDKEGVLKFELRTVVEDLTKLFVNTRSISASTTTTVLRELHGDFPSQDRTVRLVLLLTVFINEPLPVAPTQSTLNVYTTKCKEVIESLGLNPVTRQDIFDVLVNKFVPDRFGGVLEFARVALNISRKDIMTLVQDVALACLEIGCKGKMVKRLVEAYEYLHDVIAAHVLRKHRLSLEDLPSSEDEKACRHFGAVLCRNFSIARLPGDPAEAAANIGELADALNGAPPEVPTEGEENSDSDDDEETIGAAPDEDGEDLGHIGQDTLTTMIRKDEMAPTRRRRFYEMYTSFHDSVGKLPYPADYIQVGRWVRQHYGCRSAPTAVFMLHAVLNENTSVMQPYVYTEPLDAPNRVPITLKHFRMLARLGRMPNVVLWDDVESGAEFYFSEEDYLSPEELTGAVPTTKRLRNHKYKVKTECLVRAEASLEPTIAPPIAVPPVEPSSSKPRATRKRPLRSTAMKKSYAIPDSDDEAIAVDGKVDEIAKKRRIEENIQRWIKHLTLLLKEEQKKYNEKKKRELAAAEPGTKVRVPKSDFLKSLSSRLPQLRKAAIQKRQALYGADVPDEDYSEGEEDEYQYRATRAKRRRIDAPERE